MAASRQEIFLFYIASLDPPYKAGYEKQAGQMNEKGIFYIKSLHHFILPF